MKLGLISLSFFVDMETNINYIVSKETKKGG